MNKVAVNVQLTKELKIRGKYYSKSQGISFNALVRIALKEYLDRNEV